MSLSPVSKESEAYQKGYTDYDMQYRNDEPLICPYDDPQDRIAWECGVKNAYIDHITGC